METEIPNRVTNLLNSYWCIYLSGTEGVIEYPALTWNKICCTDSSVVCSGYRDPRPSRRLAGPERARAVVVQRAKKRPVQ